MPNMLRARDAWDWRLQSALWSERAFRAITARDEVNAGRYTRLAVLALDIARIKDMHARDKPEGVSIARA